MFWTLSDLDFDLIIISGVMVLLFKDDQVIINMLRFESDDIKFQQTTRAPQAGQYTSVAQLYSLTAWPLSGGS